MAGVGKLLKQAQKMQRGITEAQQKLTDERIEISHALQEAGDKARELHEATMAKATAGFQLPGF